MNEGIDQAHPVNTGALLTKEVEIRSLRNLRSVNWEPAERFNILVGDNGQGKTSLLEGLYLLSTSRSFRGCKLAELVTHGEQIASIRGIYQKGGRDREQTVGIRKGVRVVRMEGKKPKNLAVYAMETPIVVFYPLSIQLSMGGGSERRKLLDRVGLYFSETVLDDLNSYQRALHARQRILQTRGIWEADIDGWERLIAVHGFSLFKTRTRAAESLALAAKKVFDRVGPSLFDLAFEYISNVPSDEQQYQGILREKRVSDVRRNTPEIGPHRDDVALHLNQTPVRGFASQGQHRTVALTLKLAEMAILRSLTGLNPIFLLDDVLSELDPSRVSALLSFLLENKGQVFLTTTDPDLRSSWSLLPHSCSARFLVREGTVRSL
ncbi:DNA replication/repair protein RecF [Pajaroellobacter abortibovis]|uniref:DNA replication and repair protein RecF n=1 Tax=Pajaroellobacter abortibovis TaxID=1882918 RepID=A0A1L6MUQ1_9BACT|nr:DNA replication and repair protein RecF [Pajaroellobacter abortibovis]APR99233.1 hypothetical protein BCY86_00010 [Pajaroellobacter abortibovis]